MRKRSDEGTPVVQKEAWEGVSLSVASIHILLSHFSCLTLSSPSSIQCVSFFCSFFFILLSPFSDSSDFLSVLLIIFSLMKENKRTDHSSGTRRGRWSPEGWWEELKSMYSRHSLQSMAVLSVSLKESLPKNIICKQRKWGSLCQSESSSDSPFLRLEEWEEIQPGNNGSRRLEEQREKKNWDEIRLLLPLMMSADLLVQTSFYAKQKRRGGGDSQIRNSRRMRNSRRDVINSRKGNHDILSSRNERRMTMIRMGGRKGGMGRGHLMANNNELMVTMVSCIQWLLMGQSNKGGSHYLWWWYRKWWEEMMKTKILLIIVICVISLNPDAWL